MANAQQAEGSRRFAGKVALVTGAASGIGRAIAQAFADEGARVAIGDRDQAGLDSLATALGADRCWATRLDVTNDADVARFVAGAVERFGRLDCAVNAAGVASPECLPMADFSDAEFDRVMAINVRGVWLCMTHEIHAMRQSGGGAIVNIASGAGLIGVPGNAPYVTSKHAVMGMTKAAAIDHAREGIRINALCPGFTRTPMAMASIADMGLQESDAGAAAPIGRIAEAAEQASAALFLCADAASFMIGHGLVVDGGHSVQ